jgi:hypothetical protein
MNMADANQSDDSSDTEKEDQVPEFTPAKPSDYDNKMVDVSIRSNSSNMSKRHLMDLTP